MSGRGAWLRTASDVAWRLLVLLAALVALGLVLARLSIVVLPVFIGILLACAAAPAVAWLERRRVHRTIATALVFVVALGGVAGGITAIVPPIVDEFRDLGPTLEQAADDVEDWLVTGPIGLERKDVHEYREKLDDRVGDLATDSSGGVVSGARTVLELVAGLVLSLVLAFFFVKDARVIQTWAVAHLPEARRQPARTAAQRAWTTLGNYLAGAALIGLLEAVVIGVTVAIAGGSLVIPVMVLTFAAAFFPIVGAVVAGIVAVTVTLVGSGLTAAIVVLVVVVLVQQFDNDLLAPFVYGRAVHLHPVVVLAVLTAGGAIAGIAGAFVAVPVTAVLVAVGGDVWRERTADDPRFRGEAGTG